MALGCIHDDWDKNRRTKSLEQDVGDRLEHSVRDEEDGQSRIVLRGTEVQGFLQAGDLGVADVGSVKKGKQIQEAEL